MDKNDIGKTVLILLATATVSLFIYDYVMGTNSDEGDKKED